MPVNEKSFKKSQRKSKEIKPKRKDKSAVADFNACNKDNEKTLISDTNSEYPTLKMDEIKKKNNKPIEEKCKNYTHLPVYDASMERRRAKERQATVSSLFSDMDKQLSSVSDLTSSHMANKGTTQQ